MWFHPTPHIPTIPLREHQALMESKDRLIHQLQTTLAVLTGSPLPAPLPLPSSPLLHSSPNPTSTGTPTGTLWTKSRPKKPLGAEHVSTISREARQEADLKTRIQQEFKLPEYMTSPTIPPNEVAPGKTVAGGFSQPPSEPPPAKSPLPGSLSTGS